MRTVFVLRLLGLIWLGVMGLRGGAVQAATAYQMQQISPQLQVQQLAPGLYLHRSELRLANGQLFSSNGLLLETAQGYWLLDTAWGYYPTKDLLHWVEVVLKKPVVKAIATHTHDDRTGGHLVLAEQKIPLLMTQQGAQMAAAQRINTVTTGPDLQVGQSWQDGPVTWYYPGPGHSRDNIVLYLPDYQLLHGGCLVKAPQFPGLGYTGDAVLDAWPLSIQRLQQAFPQVQQVVPGHGGLGDASLLTYSLQLFKTAKAAAQ